MASSASDHWSPALSLHPTRSERSIAFTSDPDFVEDKLELLSALDPSASDIEEVEVDRVLYQRGERVPNSIGSGFEEIHQVEPGLCTHVMSGEVTRHWRLTARSRENCLRLRIPFGGEAHHRSMQKEISDFPPQCSFIIQPAETSVTGVYQAGTAYRFCSIHLSQSFLEHELRLEVTEWPKALLSGWSHQQTSTGQINLGPTSVATAVRFLNLGPHRAWRHADFRAITFDLLRQIFDAWSAMHDTRNLRVTLCQDERRRLQSLRAEANARSPRPLSMSEATIISGLNKNKIHEGFKCMFGMSLRDYCFNIRMFKARNLLMQTSLSISDIGEISGFSEPTNFSASFRKKFFRSPSEVRRFESSN